MNRRNIRLFLIQYVVIYLVISYYPTIMISLYANPLVYFIENIKFGFLFKSLIAIPISIILVVVYNKSKNYQKMKSN